MSIETHYQLNAFHADSNGREAKSVFQDLAPFQIQNSFGKHYNPVVNQIFNATVFSEPESELTTNVTKSRKRNRDESTVLMPQLPLPIPSLNFQETLPITGSSIGLNPSNGNHRLTESSCPSTSGRSPTMPQQVSNQDFLSCYYQENLEIEALIRLQHEKLRSAFGELRKRHCIRLISVLERRMQKTMKEKELELINANRKYLLLEEKMKELQVEHQGWLNLAKNNEAIVIELKSNLEQLLNQNADCNKEGYGDNGFIAGPIDDTQSCYYHEPTPADFDQTKRDQNKHHLACKNCHVNEVSVLLLPCRHLCLCKECESILEKCPICDASKNMSLQIYLS